MKKFYFVGGPKTGQAEEFFRRLNQIGGSPTGWRLYPHAINDGKALHLVDAESHALPQQESDPVLFESHPLCRLVSLFQPAIPAQLSLAKKIGSIYNAFEESDSC